MPGLPRLLRQAGSLGLACPPLFLSPAQRLHHRRARRPRRSNGGLQRGRRLSTCIPYQLNIVSDYAITQYRTNASEIAHLVRIVCSGLKAQNKSWVLASVLMTFVNQPTNAVEKVTIKYLEKGHTWMSADASHQLVQRKVTKSKVSDFDDFRQTLEETGIKTVTTVTRTHEDFFDFKPGVSQKELTLLGKEGLRPYLMMMMMIWALGRRNKEVIWRPYRLKMEDHLKIRNILRQGCLAISVNNVEEKSAAMYHVRR